MWSCLKLKKWLSSLQHLHPLKSHVQVCTLLKANFVLVLTPYIWHDTRMLFKEFWCAQLKVMFQLCVILHRDVQYLSFLSSVSYWTIDTQTNIQKILKYWVRCLEGENLLWYFLFQNGNLFFSQNGMVLPNDFKDAEWHLHLLPGL